jgi:hypothetical protein
MDDSFFETWTQDSPIKKKDTRNVKKFESKSLFRGLFKNDIFYYDRFSHLYIIDDSFKLRERFDFLLPLSILLFPLKLLKSVDNNKRASVLAPLSNKCEMLIDSDWFSIRCLHGIK